MKKGRKITIKIEEPFITVTSYSDEWGIRAFILDKDEINAIIDYFKIKTL